MSAAVFFLQVELKEMKNEQNENKDKDKKGNLFQIKHELFFGISASTPFVSQYFNIFVFCCMFLLSLVAVFVETVNVQK